MFTNDKLEKCKAYLKGKKVSVFGIGISNTPLIDFLISNNAIVIARDKKDIEEIKNNNEFKYYELIQKGVNFITGENYLVNINEEIVFKTPGMRFDKPEILKYVENGGIVTSEMELFLAICPSKIFAVTGSDGKTTTTTLIAKLLETTGRNVYLGGNIGKPLLGEIEKITPDDFTVLELSSFQLHTINRFENNGFIFPKITFPDIAIITNISPNHLDWHTNMEEYISSKHAVFKFLKKDGKLVSNFDCEYTKKISAEEKNNGKRVQTFSISGNKSSDYYFENNSIYKNDKEILKTADILLPGKHNIENYMAAIAATEDFVKTDDIIKISKTFGGVEHRIELVRILNDVKYYNSSIDSTPSRTIAALKSFPKEKNIIIILGGYDKKIPFDSIGEPICEYVKAAFLTGSTSQKIKTAIENCALYEKSKTEIFEKDNWEETIKSACDFAESGDIVILSPACASFDAFKNFEERGKLFKRIVNEL